MLGLTEGGMGGLNVGRRGSWRGGGAGGGEEVLVEGDLSSAGRRRCGLSKARLSLKAG